MEQLKDMTFQQFIDNCEVLRSQYQCLLVPFFNIEAIKCWKKMIYSLDMAEWKRDRIWEVLNGDITKEELEFIALYTK